MMLDTPPRREPPEPVIPMINIVFLLLIFFVVAAELAPTDRLDVETPSAAGTRAVAGKTILIAADGTIAYDDLRGDAALASLSTGDTVTIKADAALDAARLTDVVARLRASGVDAISLAVAPAP